MKGTKMEKMKKKKEKKKRVRQKKIKEIGTYEVKYNKQRREAESEAFPTVYKKSQKKEGLLAFSLFYLLKKIKYLTWGVTAGRRGKE